MVKVSRMRTSLLLLALAIGLTACAGGGAGTSGASVDAVETSTTDAAKTTVPLAVRALAGGKVEAFGQWQSCMALSWRYEVFARITAPEGDTVAQREAVRTALLKDGWSDATAVDDHVTVKRDDITVDVVPSPIRAPGVWVMHIRSRCADYDGDNKTRVEGDEATPLEGLVP